jgi:hypothetical protein
VSEFVERMAFAIWEKRRAMITAELKPDDELND